MQHAFTDGADDLRLLLAGYVGVLNHVDSAPATLWVRVERPRVFRWLRVPVPRALVRDMLIRHVSRRVRALRRRCCERVALADEAPEPEQLRRLDYLQQSLPTPVSLRFIVPLALVAVLLVAYVLANFVIRADQASLLGDLTTAAVNVDRGAAIDAFERNDLEASLFFGSGAILSWAVVLMLVPLLPAFSVRRRLIEDDHELSQLEARAFVALGCRPVRDLEPRIAIHRLMVAATAFNALAALVADFALEGWITCAVLLAIAAVASDGLARRDVERRQRARRWRSRLTRAALWLVWAINIVVFISVSTTD